MYILFARFIFPSTGYIYKILKMNCQCSDIKLLFRIMSPTISFTFKHEPHFTKYRSSNSIRNLFMKISLLMPNHFQTIKLHTTKSGWTSVYTEGHMLRFSNNLGKTNPSEKERTYNIRNSRLGFIESVQEKKRVSFVINCSCGYFFHSRFVSVFLLVVSRQLHMGKFDNIRD